MASSLIVWDQKEERRVMSRNRSTLEDLTIAQIRAFCLLAQHGNLANVQKLVGTDYKILQRQVDAVCKKLKDAGFGDVTTGVGKSIQITRSGDFVKNHLEAVIKQIDHLNDSFSINGHIDMSIGMTTFLLHILDKLLGKIKDRGGIVMRLVHLRTFDLVRKVETREVNFAFGGLMVEKNKSPKLSREIKYKEIFRDEFAFMANHDIRYDEEFITLDIIKSRKLPLILASTGVVFDFVCHVLNVKEPREIETELNVVQWADDVHFMLEVMRLGTQNACMFILNGVYDHFIETSSHSSSIEMSLKKFALRGMDIECVTMYLANSVFLNSLSDGHPHKEADRLINEWINDRRLSVKS